MILNYNGIQEGIENTNYFVKTDKGKFILTIYEKRVEEKETQVNELMHKMFSQFYKDPANLRTVLKEVSNQP